MTAPRPLADPEPLTGHAPAAGRPPAGPVALVRARVAVLRSRGRVTAGRGAALGPGVVLDVAAGARVHLGARSAVGGGSRLHVTGGELRLGPGVRLGEGCVVQTRTAVTIGAGARLADEVVLLDHRPVLDDVERPVRVQGTVATPIRVGRGVRIGARTLLEGGTHVGDDALLAAHLVVTGPVAPGARVIASRRS